MRNFWTWGAAMLVGACGGNTTLETSGVGGVGGVGDTAGSGGASACPSSPPSNGAVCTASGGAYGGEVADCSWGDDPRPRCRTRARCSQGSWSVSPPEPGECTAPPLPATCPAPPPAAGEACTDVTLACWYDDGARCWCSGCQGGTEYPLCMPIDPPEWACAALPAGCPVTMPQAGSACSTPGLECGPDCELRIVCEGGAWSWQQGDCPICAAPDTPIATPSGERAISSLQVGDLVLSQEDGVMVAVPILATGSLPVRHHQVVRVVLDTGRTLDVSPGHPTAGGDHFSDLRAGSALDANTIVTSARLVPYEHARTYDILPASSTGTYFAAGALIGSTLFEGCAAP